MSDTVKKKQAVAYPKLKQYKIKNPRPAANYKRSIPGPGLLRVLGTFIVDGATDRRTNKKIKAKASDYVNAAIGTESERAGQKAYRKLEKDRIAKGRAFLRGR